jgi:hypothetical protein
MLSTLSQLKVVCFAAAKNKRTPLPSTAATPIRVKVRAHRDANYSIQIKQNRNSNHKLKCLKKTLPVVQKRSY